VVLFEKGRIAGEQSGRNWGFVRQQGRDPLEIPLMMACICIWQGLEAELQADIEWRQGGVLYLAGDAATMAKYEGWLDRVKPYQLDSRKLSGAEAAELLPGMARDWAGGLLTPSDGQADPVKTTTAFARAAERLGATIHTGSVVDAVETAGGAVTGLRTELGEIRAKAVLLAAGVWSDRMLRALGLNLPQLRVCSTVLSTTAVPEKTGLGVWSPQFGLRQRRDGCFNIGGGARVDHQIGIDSFRHFMTFRRALKGSKAQVSLGLGRHFLDDLRGHLDGAHLGRQLRRDRVLDPAPNRRTVAHCLDAFRATFPEFRDIDMTTAWAGFIEVTPDELPVFGPLPGIDGLVVATGFSGHGFGLGPITGRLMAEVIADGKASLDIGDFQFSRFAEPQTRIRQAV
jgi:glycine/D-amino acid oxidase-like deaminating enzyme